MPGRRVALGARTKRGAGLPPWWSAVVVEEQRYRELQDDLERCRARRSLMVFLGYRYFGASTRWLADQLGISHVRVQALMAEGKTVALSGVAEGDLEKLVEMCFGPEAVGLGWDGAGAAG
jgi:hypothetical protein